MLIGRYKNKNLAYIRLLDSKKSSTIGRVEILKKTKAIIAVLVISAHGFGAIRTVNPITGSDVTKEPYKTINAAYDDAGSGDTIILQSGTYAEATQGAVHLDLDRDGINITIESETGDAADVTIAMDIVQSTVQIDTTGTVTFNNVTFCPETGPHAIIQGTTDKDNATVTFTGCIFETTGSGNAVFLSEAITAAGPTRDFYFTDCTFTDSSPSDGQNGMFHIWDVDEITFTNCTFTKEGTDGFLLEGEVGKFELDGCTLTWTSDGTEDIIHTLDNDDSPEIGTLIVEDCTITYSAGSYYISTNSLVNMYYFQDCDYLLLRNNTMTGLVSMIYLVDKPTTRIGIIGNTFSSSRTGNPICIGHNTQNGAPYSPTDTITGGIISGNTITKTSSLSGHCIMLGTNTHGWSIVDNLITSTKTSDWGLVIKGDNHCIRGNVIKSSTPLYLYGAYNNEITNNTLYAIDNYAIQYNDGPAAGPGGGNRVYNNIIDGSAGYYAVFVNAGAIEDNYFDYNHYVAGSSGVFSHSGAKTLAQMVTYWQANAAVFSNNDAHSLSISDPKYSGLGNNILSLLPSSPCLNAGKPTVHTGYTTIGAWQPQSGDDYWPNLDFLNGVDFKDFSILARDWGVADIDLPGDLNFDDVVDVNDLAKFCLYWLSDCYEQ